MKRLYTLLVGAACAGAMYAQPCTPDPLYADSVFGVWPDTTTNFMSGTVGVVYAQQMDIIVPENAGEIDPNFSFVTIDSIALTGIDGLPAGLEVTCASQTAASCTYLAGVLGCGVIQGVPTNPGMYELTLNVMAHGNFLGNVMSIPYSFTGYRIEVDGEISVGELDGPILGASRNVPNPFTARTSIEFSLAAAGTVQVRVFNLLGEELWTRTVDGRPGLNKVAFEGGDLGDGVYLYKVETGQNTSTGRMVLRR